MTSSGSILSLITHHITSGTVLAPTGYKDHKVGGITYILSTDSTQSTLDSETISNLVYIHWEEYRYCMHISTHHLKLSSQYDTHISTFSFLILFFSWFISSGGNFIIKNILF